MTITAVCSIEIGEKHKLAQTFLDLGDGSKWGNSSVSCTCIVQMDLGLVRLMEHNQVRFSTHVQLEGVNLS